MLPRKCPLPPLHVPHDGISPSIRPLTTPSQLCPGHCPPPSPRPSSGHTAPAVPWQVHQEGQRHLCCHAPHALLFPALVPGLYTSCCLRCPSAVSFPLSFPSAISHHLYSRKPSWNSFLRGLSSGLSWPVIRPCTYHITWK